MNNKPTIHDIAKALGINSSTVSRALNDSPRVTQKTKNKILAMAQELGYQRNVLASNLRKNVTHTIGVIVPRISRHFFSSAIQGIEETAYAAGYNVIICQSLEQLEREQSIVNGLVEKRVDGLLISISMETLNYDHLDLVAKNKIPLVFFDRHCNIPNYSSVIIDDFKGGFEATEHLIKQGCKHIAHFSGPKNLEIYKNRLAGYKAALKKHKLTFNESYVITSRLMEDDGYANMKVLIDKNIEIDAVFSANDMAAIGAIKFLKQQKIAIPEDIAIVGFSNEPISTAIEPSLTTIDQSGLTIGKTATNLLLNYIEEKSIPEKGKTVIIDTSLLERNSSKKE
ncbi:LacI family DNA-binding transcriptional regulator [Neotamlana laminarinivorans]|uniref:LacI family transcriptional regulator n=1 Tax=Neotamlana laminarinivorans TaxID=2883124 RepID=A0A9X1L3U2_9FLAO|nr:LacI family DNA-binding transcriptional regulator [Tamlana laminarinivorans]MCB4798824.1 LacI family transcriptional regulator [Tamlana laminarinivorans]